ncbi:MAG: hypothetical protein LUE22_04200 [Oscillospiraceae bacterium]|nr:hypothetical protein [Oscillospiraceae bacterium]
MTESVAYEKLLTDLQTACAALAKTDPASAASVEEAAEIIPALTHRVAELEEALAAAEGQIKRRRERQLEGIVAAQERGVAFGRPRMPLPDNFEEVKNLWFTRQISSREGARRLGVSQDTFLRWCRTR